MKYPHTEVFHLTNAEAVNLVGSDNPAQWYLSIRLDAYNINDPGTPMQDLIMHYVKINYNEAYELLRNAISPAFEDLGARIIVKRIKLNEKAKTQYWITQSPYITHWST